MSGRAIPQASGGSEELGGLAPRVVAVVVACDPGEWFEQELAALAAQDYPEFSVLVLDAGAGRDLAERVATVLPDASVRRLWRNEGFGASANAALDMVEDASHFLFCHDDVVPDPDVVSTLVRTSVLANAAVVGPKVVSFEDPRRLLHVGMAVDKVGAVVDRVEVGERDHGQHDSVRDVFIAGGGCTLVRADLFSAIGGFDPRIFAMGEELDLCWRARLAGARVVVAPAARVRHLEVLAGGLREVPDAVHVGMPASADGVPVNRGRPGDTAAWATGAGASAGASDGGGARRRRDTRTRVRSRRIRRGISAPRRRAGQVTLQSLQRRHELRAVLKCTPRLRRVRVVFQLLVLSIAEILIALIMGHRDRAAAVVHAWRWNVGERSSLRAVRAQVQALGRVDHRTVRRRQVRGSARVGAFVHRVRTHGVHAARLGVLDEPASAHALESAPVPVHGAGAGVDTHDGSWWEEDRRRIAHMTRLSRAVVWAVVALVVIFGSRQLLRSGFPSVGQLVPFAPWSSFLHRFVSGWQPAGVGVAGAASPANGLLGLGELVLGGGAGVLQKVVVLGCVPVGAIGMSRLLGPFGSVRARLAAAVVYLALPLAYDALATGRWDALLAYAAGPWIMGRLARASGVEPFDSFAPARPVPHWRETLVGRAVGLGVLEALLTAAVPAGIVFTLVVTAGLALGIVVTDPTDRRSSVRCAARVVGVGCGATIVAAVLLVPWTASLLGGPVRWQVLTGLASSPASSADWGSLLHLGVGPIGDTPLAWGFAVAAAVPLLIGRGSRLAWSSKGWVLALWALLLAWAGGRGWLGSFAMSSEILLVPAAVGLSLAIGLGVASFEEDLAGQRMGWRHAAGPVAAVCVAAAAIPVLAASASGRWDMPATGYGQATSWIPHGTQGQFRVLWVGDPEVLPGGAWPIAPGLAYALSEKELPDASSLWSGSSPGRAGAVGEAVRLVASGQTVRAGHLLAPYAIRYVVVVSTLGPATPGTSQLVRNPPPRLLPGLSTQLDLRQVINQAGVDVFVDDLASPKRAVHEASSSQHDLALGIGLAVWLVVVGAFAVRWRWLERWLGATRRRGHRPRRQQRSRPGGRRHRRQGAHTARPSGRERRRLREVVR